MRKDIVEYVLEECDVQGVPDFLNVRYPHKFSLPLTKDPTKKHIIDIETSELVGDIFPISKRLVCYRQDLEKALDSYLALQQHTLQMQQQR